MLRMNKKNSFSQDYNDLSFEDVRTIPDFYDNLYPSNDSDESYVLSTSLKPAKKLNKVRKNQKKQDN